MASDPTPTIMRSVFRLLRLHAMVRAAIPSSVDATDVTALSETYTSLRAQARELAIAVDMTADQFDREVPALSEAVDRRHGRMSIKTHVAMSGDAATAAARLRSLGGFVEGLVQMAIITGDLTEAQATRAQAVLAKASPNG